MEVRMLQKKKFFIALVFMGSLLIAGSLAWTNFGSSVLNAWFGEGADIGPGGTLHNDHNPGEGDVDHKDIYVENWGSEPLLVRIRLTEYMEIGIGAGIREGEPGTNLAISIDGYEGRNINDHSTWTPHDPEANDDVFRQYWRWTMGGQKYYFPAPYDLRGELDPATGFDFISTSSPAMIDPDDIESMDRAKQTLYARVLTMSDWIDSGGHLGNYWVLDSDGYAYWAAPLLSGDATGLLLHKIEQIQEPTDYYFYAIHVHAHMATIDNAPNNYEMFLDDASVNAKVLVNRVAEEIKSMTEVIPTPTEVPEGPTEPNDPEGPTEPNDPEDPTEPNDPEDPTDPPCDVKVTNSITGVSANLDTGIISVEVTADSASFLELRVLNDVSGSSTDWKSGALIASGRTGIIEPVEKAFIDVAISSVLPQHFVVIASLVDSDGNELCEPFVFLNFTNAHEQFLAKTVYDFNEDKVIRLDGSYNNNFMVVRDDVTKIQEGENGRNSLDVSRIEEDIYIFGRADNTISSLNINERIVVVSEDGENVYLISVLNTHINGDVVSLTAASNYALSDFFIFVKINYVEEIDSVIIDMSETDPNLELVFDHADPNLDTYSEQTRQYDTQHPRNNNDDSRDNNLIHLDDVSSHGINLNFTHPWPPSQDDRLFVNGSISYRLTISATFSYDPSLFGESYTYCSLIATTEFSLTVSGQLRLDDEEDPAFDFEIRGPKILIPTKVPGLTGRIKLAFPLDWELSAAVTGKYTNRAESGFIYCSISGHQIIDNRESFAECEMTGTARLAFGVEATLSLDFFRVVEFQVILYVGLELRGTLFSSGLNISNAPSRHECELCIEGVSYVFATLTFRFLIQIITLNDSRLDVTHEARRYLDSFYISLINDAASVHNGQISAGWGSRCPNVTHRTTIIPRDEQGVIIGSATVDIDNRDTGRFVYSGTGQFTVYLYDGNYVALAIDDGLTLGYMEFSVDSNAQEVNIFPNTSMPTPEPTPGPEPTPNPEPTPSPGMFRTEIVFLLDFNNSPENRNLRGLNTTLARRITEKLDYGNEIKIVVLDGSVIMKLDFTTDRQAVYRKLYELSSVDYTNRADLSYALANIADLFSASDSHLGRKQLIVFTDGTNRDFNPNYQQAIRAANANRIQANVVHMGRIANGYLVGLAESTGGIYIAAPARNDWVLENVPTRIADRINFHTRP